jgi:two-component system chemotaxis response regulator CheY
MAKIMGRIITTRDMEVVATATDGEQAIKKYKELYPNIDLVTLNILMPDMDSVTVLKKILEFDKNAKVLMVAPEEGNEDELKECILTGAKSYVKKPLEQNKVLERIAAIMPNI